MSTAGFKYFNNEYPHGSPYPPYFKFTPRIAQKYGFKRYAAYTEMSIYVNENGDTVVVFTDEGRYVLAMLSKNGERVKEVILDEFAWYHGIQDAVEEVFKEAAKL